MAAKRFLVVRLGSLGDIVHTFPAVAGLRESFSTAEIIWLAHPRWRELVASTGLATDIWPVNSRDLSSLQPVIQRVRKSAWDAAIDYQGLWKSAFLPFFGGVKRRIGFSSVTIREYGVPILYTDRVTCRAAHIADQNGELTLCAGATKPVGPFTLRIAERDAQDVRERLAKVGVSRYVILSPGGGWRSKCWPAERFGSLCQRIKAQVGLHCVINYGPGEEQLAAAVQSASGTTDPILYDGELGQLMALLRGAACIVGGDTGPLHLAVALGTPAVALFGPTDPARNGPYSPKETVLRSPNATTTYKRGDTADFSLMQLSVDDVFAAVQRRLAALS
jgi:ADP-heptose:LPS heptosyltransferase